MLSSLLYDYVENRGPIERREEDSELAFSPLVLTASEVRRDNGRLLCDRDHFV